MNFSETSPELDVNTLFSWLHSMLNLSRGLGVYPLPPPPPPPLPHLPRIPPPSFPPFLLTPLCFCQTYNADLAYSDWLIETGENQNKICQLIKL